MTRKTSESITIRDVAEQAGVSVATVSRYLNDSAPVSGEVGIRIQKVMTDLKYVPHAAARQLASQKTMVIGLLLNNIYNDYFGPLLYGVESVVQQNGYNLLVATNRPNQHPPSYQPLGSHNVDGLLVFADSLNDEELLRLQSRKMPTVLIHRSSPSGSDIPSVTVENKAATYHLIDHLIKEHGRRRIVFVRGPVYQEDSYWREMGYRQALEAHAIPFDPDLILTGDFEREVAYQSMKKFLSNGKSESFDAVFAGDDTAAVGVLDALKENNFRIPEDVAVVGFDDSLLSSFLIPALTTVKAPTYDVGRCAAENLIRMLNRQVIENVTLLPTELIIRNSCGCTG